MKKSKRKLNLFYPGQKGYDPKYPYPWRGIGEMAGLDQRPNIVVDGFYVIDRRVNPPIAIFENCQVVMKEGVRPVLDNPPQPWRSPGAAADYIKSLHLPKEMEEICIRGKGPIRICAMVPDPGIGYPHPDTLLMDKKGFEDW